MEKTNLELILEQVKVIIAEAKKDILPLLKKDAWDSWDEVCSNAGEIYELITEVGKVLVVARVSVLGDDGILDYADVKQLINQVTIIINAILDIPVLPESVEGKIINFLLSGAYKVASKKWKVLPQEFAAYTAIIETDLAPVTA